MSYRGRIVEHLDTFIDSEGVEMIKVVMELPSPNQLDKEKGEMNPTPDKVYINHDYIRIQGSCNIIQKLDDTGNYPIKDTKGAANWIEGIGSITLGIREVKHFLLPLLLDSKYLKDEHFEPRVDSSGNYYNPYCYGSSVIHYKKEGIDMVRFRRSGDCVYSDVTLDVFNTIKDSLELYYTEKEKKSS